MNEQANKVLAELLQKASSGIDAAVSFSQAQIPDVIHQLLLWNFVQSLIMTIIALASIPLAVWIIRSQCKKVEIGIIGGEGWSWEKGNPKYASTLVWSHNGELNPLVLPFGAVLLAWLSSVLAVLANPAWLKIWLAPKLYLIEYAASLMK
ncbi:hypothetical protein HQN64_20345 [Enterobacteriaceae bacterium BIT-l23]|uniref:hypothetical protein n=1 Tax=Jejubacter sp. L23 TaxID=3092086 RepID=UPI0015850F11|nr:hypothetical protein [Enterobacteriaceae bacterium BIT-l23]